MATTARIALLLFSLFLGLIFAKSQANAVIGLGGLVVIVVLGYVVSRLVYRRLDRIAERLNDR